MRNLLKLANPLNWFKTGLKVGFWVAVAVFFCIGFMCLGFFALSRVIGPQYATIPQTSNYPANTATDCYTRAMRIGAPSLSSICKAPVTDVPAQRVVSGTFVEFGTITFDAETRVWILEDFFSPKGANYTYDYSGREQNVLNAPFVTGSEMNPVTGGPFQICWDTVSAGCTPPVAIRLIP